MPCYKVPENPISPNRFDWNGGDCHTLPNSRLNVGIPMLAYYTAVKNYPFKDRGIMPDHEVKRTIEDILNKKDTILSFTLELIEEQK